MGDVLLAIENGVATITLNRPKKGNAFTADMVLNLTKHFEDLQKREGISSIVLTGKGKCFCSGMDLSAKNQSNMKVSMAQKTAAFINLCEIIKACKLPVIAKLNGPALGGGIVLLFLADIRLMHKAAYIQFSEIKRGLIPAMISTYIVPQVGAFLGRELFLTGRRLSATRAYELGLVTEISDDIHGLTKEFTNHLNTSAPHAMTLAKGLVSYIETHSHKENVKEAQLVFQKCMMSGEMMHGLQAFRQRQTPDWSSFRRSRL